jgi:splicing factor 45
MRLNLGGGPPRLEKGLQDFFVARVFRNPELTGFLYGFLVGQKMDLYTNLPSTKDGTDVSMKASAAKRALMAPMLLRQKLAAAKPNPSARPTTSPAVYTGATGLRVTHTAPSHLARDMEVCDEGGSDEAEDSSLQELDDTHRFPECDEYDPFLPSSMESVLRAREAARVARQLQRDLEREQEELDVRERSLPTVAPSSVPSRGGGRGVNNLPAWMRGSGEGPGPVSKLPAQDGSAFIGDGDLAGLGSTSLGDIAAAVGGGGAPASAPAAIAAAVVAPSPDVPSSKALKMMAAWGYKRGEGLGKDGTGITAALEHVKTGSRSGVIVSRGTAQLQQGTNALASAVGAGSASSGGSRVVMLCNMAAPGEVDDDLAEEVQQECTEKYGAVQQCFVFECAGALRLPPEEAVRTFVMFEDVKAAESAKLGLDGRFFGGRKVRASFFDETKFLRFDLAPDAS